MNGTSVLFHLTVSRVDDVAGALIHFASFADGDMSES